MTAPRQNRPNTSNSGKTTPGKTTPDKSNFDKNNFGKSVRPGPEGRSAGAARGAGLVRPCAGAGAARRRMRDSLASPTPRWILAPTIAAC